MREKVKNLRQSDGFTIIEVLIVLAIAGLIMLIVFLAVPALQRNSRNTQRRTDVSSLLTAVTEYVSNNNGSLPTKAQCAGAQNADCFTANYKPAFYKDATAVTYAYTDAVASSPVGPGAEKVTIYTGAKCDNNTPNKVGATARQVIAVYSIETSGTTQQQCRESGI